MLVRGGGYCEEHRPARTARHHGQATRLYGTSRWQRARVAFLGEHPWCQHCGTEPAVDVHHAVPHGGNVEVFWDMSRWVALCKACHGAETAREMNGPGTGAGPGDGGDEYVLF